MENALLTPTTPDTLHAWIQEYYGKILTTQSDLQTNACCADDAPPGWVRSLLANVPPEVLDRFYGCGYPIPPAISGATVLDLGCGSGRDVYMISELVGPGGHVHGVDMTAEQLAVARAHVDWHRQRMGRDQVNVHFHEGYIEDLGSLPLAPGSVDAIVSNCVVNLSPRKDLVLEGAFRLLKPGGEFLLSDVVVDRRLPDDVRADRMLQGECLGGALYKHDLFDLVRRSGFLDPRVVSERAITIDNDEARARVGAARFTSLTLRLFKLEDLEPRCEDYGQLATYRGTVPHAPGTFWLDDHHAFEAGRPERVCGNTAAMIADTRLAAHFDVVGDHSMHFGEFPCGPTLAAGTGAGAGGSAGEESSCC